MQDWARPMIVVATAVGAIILNLLLHAIFKRISTRTRWLFDDDVVKYWKWPTLVIFPLIAVIIVFPIVKPIQIPERTHDAIRHVLTILLIITIAWLLVDLVKVFALSIVRGHNFSKSTNNLRARQVLTQLVVMKRLFYCFIILLAIALIVLTFPRGWEFGASMLASAGAASLILGLAAKPSIENIIASLQIALTQPIILDDDVVIDGESGKIEEIKAQFVVVRTWDERRLIVPLTRFIGQSFENLTRGSSQKLGTVFFYLDYHVPIDDLREQVENIVKQTSYWDRRHVSLAVTDIKDTQIEIRCLLSASNPDNLFSLRCFVREEMVKYIRSNYRDSLPMLRFKGAGGSSRTVVDESDFDRQTHASFNSEKTKG
ncbi:hypothetical protein K7432_006048 [Basidiobolus ranarum]|uniref:Mechanosensitive ion channel MscS domain-containing protein n=1 Tax=Basidiobolus ranarum TaxID=34480 RepID=A0ABR2W2C8_9FUNG